MPYHLQVRGAAHGVNPGPASSKHTQRHTTKCPRCHGGCAPHCTSTSQHTSFPAPAPSPVVVKHDQVGGPRPAVCVDKERRVGRRQHHLRVALQPRHEPSLSHRTCAHSRATFIEVAGSVSQARPPALLLASHSSLPQPHPTPTHPPTPGHLSGCPTRRRPSRHTRRQR